MSAIQQELCKATGTDPKKFADRAAFLVGLVKAVNGLDDNAWAKLSAKAQDWTNDGADAVKKKADVAEFPDYEEPKAAEEPRSSRRRSADPEPEPAAGEETAVEKLEEGDRVKITYKKRGDVKTAEGKVVEVSKRKGFLVVKSEDGAETEIDFDVITMTEVFHGTAGTAPPADAEQDAGPAVGDEVELTTKRGKTVTGELVEVNDEKGYIVVKEKDGETEVDLDRIDGDIKVLKKAKAAAEPEPATSRRRSASADDKKTEEAKDDTKKRSGNPKGVSVGGRIRELMAEDPDLSEEAVGKVLTKEGIEFRPPTLNMIWKDCADFIKKLRDAGQLKKGK